MTTRQSFRFFHDNYAHLRTRYCRSRLFHRGHVFPAYIGENGLTHCKSEGDLATPVGVLPLRRVFYRADRVHPPETDLPCRAIRPDDGWCDDPESFTYNRLINRPHAARHETLMRDDPAYDIVAVLGWNDDPPRPGQGSAIFLHHKPLSGVTAGCIALSPRDLRHFLSLYPKGIIVHPSK